MAEETKDIRTTRVHKTLAARDAQLTLNLSVLRGGGDYIQRRLSKHPSETDTSWIGVASGGTMGRKDRAYLINYASRIATKINQYQFSGEVDRAGVDPVFESDCTGTGTTLTEFWRQASELQVANRWAWIGIDRAAAPRNPQTGEVVQRSQAEREAAGDRIRFTLYPAQAVVDWA